MKYLPAIVWIVLLSFVLTRHIKVYRLYDAQLKVVSSIEQLGEVETGSTLVAVNQRVRYAIRIALATAGLLIGVAAVYGIYRPSFGQSVTFGVAVLIYFYASEASTGYLTIRDKRVLDHLMVLDEQEEQKSLKENTQALKENTAATKENTEARDE